MDKGIEVAPLVAMRHHRSRALSPGTPDPAQDMLKTDPALVGRPQLEHRLRVGVLQGVHDAGQTF